MVEIIKEMKDTKRKSPYFRHIIEIIAVIAIILLINLFSQPELP